MNVVSIVANNDALCALKDDQTIVVWGDSGSGGNNEEVKDVHHVMKVVGSHL